MSTLDDTPTKMRISQLAQGDNGQSILGMLSLHEVSRAILDSFICANSQSSRVVNAILDEEELQQIHSSQMLTPDGRFMCRSRGFSAAFKHDGKRRRDHEQQHDPPPTTTEALFSDSTSEKAMSPAMDQKRGDTYNYNCCLLSYGLLFVEFLDAIAEGDGDRNLRCWKVFLLHFKNDTGSTKYALQALYYSLQVHSLLTPCQGYRLMWNRSVKGKGSNVPLDLDLKHDNKDLKEEVRELKRNVTVKAVTRLCKTQFVKRKTIANYDDCIKRMRRSGKRTIRSDSKDFATVLNRLVVEGAFEFKVIPQYCIAHSYCVISMCRLTGANNFPQAKLDSEINVCFLLKEHGGLYFLFHNNSVHIVLLNLKEN